MNLQEASTIIKSNYPNLEGQLIDKIRHIVKDIENKDGFINSHIKLNREMKKFTDKKHWHLACTRFEGYEKEWVLTIANYLSN